MRPLPAILSTSEIVVRSASFTLAASPVSMADADVAQRAAQPGTHLAIALATFDVLTMSLQRGIVTSHLILVLSRVSCPVAPWHAL